MDLTKRSMKEKIENIIVKHIIVGQVDTNTAADEILRLDGVSGCCELTEFAEWILKQNLEIEKVSELKYLVDKAFGGNKYSTAKELVEIWKNNR